MSILMVSISWCRKHYNSYSHKSCYLMFNKLMWSWILRFHLCFFHICVKYDLNVFCDYPCCFNTSHRWYRTHSLPQSRRAVMCCLTSLMRSWVRWPTKTCRLRSKISFITCHSLWNRSPSFFYEDKQKTGMINVKCWRYSFNKRFILL